MTPLLFFNIALHAVDFVAEVRPILEAHCYDCHAGETHKSGFRLDVKSSAFRGGDNHGPDILPRDAAGSPLIQFITQREGETRMPPKGPRLSPEEIEILTRWVNEGAVWPDGIDRVELEDTSDHWSFKPLTIPEGNHSIDAFIKKGLEKNGLRFSPETDRRSWLRRVTLDLTGLPPAPQEIDDFLSDSSKEAHEKVVERLLDSPRYGERWAQHWLDVVRYADTHGFEVNTERTWAWPYRDYVIRAFNENMPWDQFIRESIAGDVFHKPEATGFLVTAAALLPGQIGKDEASIRLARQDELGEIVTNVGESFLGLSIGCARCHDHKFDPIPARDYYSMQAFFAGVRYGDRPLEDPETEALVTTTQAKLQAIDKQLDSLILPADTSTQRAPLSTKANLEIFHPIEAKQVRFTILATIRDNLREPYIDEFEIYNSEGKNIALEATAKSKGANKEAINDGVYGNKSAWKSRTKGRGEVILTFPQPQTISKIIWGRDRTGAIPDRLASSYRIDVETVSGNWKTVASSENRSSFDPASSKADLYQEKDIIPQYRKRAREFVEKRRPLAAVLVEKNGGRQFVFAAQSNAPEPMFLLNRGDPEQPTEELSPASLSFLNPVSLPAQTNDKKRRLTIANWIADPNNPLTARVIVNRIWQWHFGTGLVSTPNDFGNLGSMPTHPELLDWLANQFIQSGWSIKDLHRRVVLSSTYRQSSLVHSAGQAQDSDVKLLWRFPTRRLEAEAIRDSILAVSGQLDETRFGPGFNLFHSRGGTGGFKPIDSHRNPGGKRRMIYAYKVRMEREGVFGAFDCPDAGQSAPRRSQSTTPIQALNLFNSPFTIDLADQLAERVRKESGESPISQVALTWNYVLGRPPTPEESEESLTLISDHGLSALCRALFNANEFLFLP